MSAHDVHETQRDHIEQAAHVACHVAVLGADAANVFSAGQSLLTDAWSWEVGRPTVMDDRAQLRKQITVLEQEKRELSSRVREYEAEIEMLGNSVIEQRLCIVSGYIVSIRREEDGYIAHCPTLRAIADGPSSEKALKSLRDAMQVSVQGHEKFGIAIPPKDTEAQCPD